MLAFRALPAKLSWHGRPAWASVGLGIAAISALLDAKWIVTRSLRRGAIHMKFNELVDQGGSVGAYLATYLLPFLGVTPTKLGDWFAYAVYLGVAMVVFVRTDLALVNPTLYLFGWRAVLVVPKQSGVSQEAPVIVLCRDPTALLAGADVVRVAGCYIAKREGVPATR
jgi:hypothetical protein